MPRQLFAKIAIQGRKGWGSRDGAFTKAAVSVSIGSLQNFSESCSFFTVGEDGSIVTHNGSVIPSEHKTKAQLLVSFER